MKVLFINTVFEKGSTGRIVKELGEAVEENGGEYRVAYGRGFYDDEHCYRIGSDIDLYIHAFLSRLTDRAGFYSTEATKKLIRFIKEYNPDVIHLHNLHGYYINIGVLFNYLKTEFVGKVIWTLHDCWAFTGHCVHYLFSGCNRWKTDCYSCPEKKRYPASYLFDASSRNYIDKRKIFTDVENLTIVTPSKWLAGEVKQSFLCDYPVEVINNGIDLTLFSLKEIRFEECQKEKKKIVVLNVADGKDDRKGYQDIIRLRDELSDQYEIMIVGLTQKEIDCLPAGITGIRRTSSQSELVKLYQQADYFINPTYEDTFPTVNIEAMACGTPVITYDAGGSPESIDMNSGEVVECGDIKAMARAIENRSFLAYNCRTRAESYDANLCYQKYMSLYRK